MFPSGWRVLGDPSTADCFRLREPLLRRALWRVASRRVNGEAFAAMRYNLRYAREARAGQPRCHRRRCRRRCRAGRRDGDAAPLVAKFSRSRAVYPRTNSRILFLLLLVSIISGLRFCLTIDRRILWAELFETMSKIVIGNLKIFIKKVLCINNSFINNCASSLLFYIARSRAAFRYSLAIKS